MTLMQKKLTEGVGMTPRQVFYCELWFVLRWCLEKLGDGDAVGGEVASLLDRMAAMSADFEPVE